MAEHVMNTHGLTPDEFYADRQQFWKGFTHFVIACAVAVAVILILMAIFLL
jgi:hypothetical protein